MMILIYMSCSKIMRRLKNKKAVGNDGIPSELQKFASERLLTIMSIYLSGCVLTGKRRMVDELLFFDYSSPFCFLFIEFHYIFPHLLKEYHFLFINIVF